MASADDVAAYILEQRGQMSAIKLQKLVYYCQAWHLVLAGPAAVRRAHRGMGEWPGGARPLSAPPRLLHREEMANRGAVEADRKSAGVDRRCPRTLWAQERFLAERAQP